jgi:hypothetical protein
LKADWISAALPQGTPAALTAYMLLSGGWD